MDDQERIRRQRLSELRKEIAIGVAQIERGEAEPLNIEEFLAEARAEWEARRNKRRGTPPGE
jgi:hypothetical protein